MFPLLTPYRTNHLLLQPARLAFLTGPETGSRQLEQAEAPKEVLKAANTPEQARQELIKARGEAKKITFEVHSSAAKLPDSNPKKTELLAKIGKLEQELGANSTPAAQESLETAKDLTKQLKAITEQALTLRRAMPMETAAPAVQVEANPKPADTALRALKLYGNAAQETANKTIDGNLFELALGGQKEVNQKLLDQQLGALSSKIQEAKTLVGPNGTPEQKQQLAAAEAQLAQLSGAKVKGVEVGTALKNNVAQSAEAVRGFAKGAAEAGLNTLKAVLNPLTYVALADAVSTAVYEDVLASSGLGPEGANQGPTEDRQIVRVKEAMQAVTAKLTAMGAAFQNASIEEQGRLIGEAVGTIDGGLAGGMALSKLGSLVRARFLEKAGASKATPAPEAPPETTGTAKGKPNADASQAEPSTNAHANPEAGEPGSGVNANKSTFEGRPQAQYETSGDMTTESLQQFSGEIRELQSARKFLNGIEGRVARGEARTGDAEKILKLREQVTKREADLAARGVNVDKAMVQLQKAEAGATPAAEQVKLKVEGETKAPKAESEPAADGKPTLESQQAIREDLLELQKDQVRLSHAQRRGDASQIQKFEARISERTARLESAGVKDLNKARADMNKPQNYTVKAEAAESGGKSAPKQITNASKEAGAEGEALEANNLLALAERSPKFQELIAKKPELRAAAAEPQALEAAKQTVALLEGPMQTAQIVDVVKALGLHGDLLKAAAALAAVSVYASNPDQLNTTFNLITKAQAEEAPPALADKVDYQGALDALCCIELNTSVNRMERLNANAKNILDALSNTPGVLEALNLDAVVLGPNDKIKQRLGADIKGDERILKLQILTGCAAHDGLAGHETITKVQEYLTKKLSPTAK